MAKHQPSQYCYHFLNKSQVVLEDAKTSEKPSITPSPESPTLTAQEIDKKLQERSVTHFCQQILFSKNLKNAKSCSILTNL